VTTGPDTRTWPTSRGSAGGVRAASSYTGAPQAHGGRCMTRIGNFKARVTDLIWPFIGGAATGLPLISAMRVRSYFGTFHTLGEDETHDV
jgi:hypothetical protein